ncbi:MAG TPA: adenylate kinase family protein [Candidatus Thermoplasmatota archaeon]
MTGPSPWIGLSGTPGVGKTTVAKLLRKRGIAIWDGRKLAKEARAYVGRDKTRRTRIVDVLVVARYLRLNLPSAPPVIIDSHWAHEIPGVNTVIVLRLHPRQLRERLVKRRWPGAKVSENVEAEGVGIIVSESAKRLPRERIAELDATGLAPQEVLDRLLPFLDSQDPVKTGLEMGNVDWSKDVDEWMARRPTAARASGPRAP